MTYDEVRDQRSQIPLRSRDHMRSRDKLKAKYSFFQKTYGHQTLKDADMRRGEAQNEVTRLPNHMITRGHVLNWKNTITSSTRPMTTKPGMVVTYGDRNPAME